ncbi:hypothetical protein [Yoonia sp. MH D7]
MNKKIKTRDIQKMKTQFASLPYKAPEEISAKAAVADMIKEINVALKNGHSLADVCAMFNEGTETTLSTATFRTYLKAASNQKPKRKTSNKTAITTQSTVSVETIETKNETSEPTNTAQMSDETVVASITPTIMRDYEPRTSSTQSTVAEPPTISTPQVPTPTRQVEATSCITDSQHRQLNGSHENKEDDGYGSIDRLMRDIADGTVTPTAINQGKSDEATL